ncbi:MAG: prepilin-type N-terminal cleavage/methylation domain-containing protein [Planctomycetota bacterium]
MSRRAYTLIELLLSLVLLALLSIAAAGWVAGALRLQHQRQAVAASYRSVSAFERALRIDLLNHDVQVPGGLSRSHRVQIVGGALHITTRERGPAEAVYIGLPDGKLRRTCTPIDGSESAHSTIIASGIHNLRWSSSTTDSDADRSNAIADQALWSASQATLTATWTNKAGDSVALHIQVPGEWLP